MFINEIKRLNDNKSELINFYKNNKKRFELNKEKVTQVLDVANVDYKFFESLI